MALEPLAEALEALEITAEPPEEGYFITASRHKGSRFQNICWGCDSVLAHGGICKRRNCPLKTRDIAIWYVREPIRAHNFLERGAINEIKRIYRGIFKNLCRYWPCVRHEAVKSDCEGEVTRVVTKWWDINFNTEMLNPDGHDLWNMMHDPIPWGRPPFTKQNKIGSNVVLLSERQKERIEIAVGRGYMEQF